MPFREGTIGLFKCFMGKCFDTAEPTCHASISLVRYKVNLQVLKGEITAAFCLLLDMIQRFEVAYTFLHD